MPRLRRMAILSCSELVGLVSTRIATTRPYGQADGGNCANTSSTSSGFRIRSSWAAIDVTSPIPSGRMTRYGLLQFLTCRKWGYFPESLAGTFCSNVAASGGGGAFREQAASDRLIAKAQRKWANL